MLYPTLLAASEVFDLICVHSQHRIMMKTTGGAGNSKTGIILVFLTESGIIFCILQVWIVQFIAESCYAEPGTLI